MQEWTPWQAWWLDLLKFAITFTVGAIITLLFVDRIQRERDRKRSLQRTVFELDLNALRDFDKAASTYEVAGLSAYASLYKWIGHDKTEPMRWYEGRAYGEYLAAFGELRRRFDGHEGFLELFVELTALHRDRHDLYGKLVDDRLEHEPTKHINPGATRAEFDGLLEKARRLRGQILGLGEAGLLSG